MFYSVKMKYNTHCVLNHIHTVLPHGVDILYDVYLAFSHSLSVESIQRYERPCTTDSGTGNGILSYVRGKFAIL